MKCRECKTFKKADNCQQCFLDLKSHYWQFINELFSLTEIIHISTIDKIKEVLREKKEEVRNFGDPEQRILRRLREVNDRKGFKCTAKNVE